MSWLAVEVLSMSKIKVRISETKYRSFYKTLVGAGLVIEFSGREKMSKIYKDVRLLS